MNTFMDIISIIGGLFEIIGVYFMAERYLRLSIWDVACTMLVSLWRGQLAKENSQAAHFSGEDTTLSLQGLSYIGLGFLLQLLNNIFDLYQLYCAP